MSWWSDAKTEPYRQFRFQVQFGALGVDKYHVMKVDKPMFKVGEYNHKIFNHQVNFPGRLVWDPVTITVVDMPGASGAQSKLMAAVKASGYGGLAGGSTNTDGLSKYSATAALGTITITQMKSAQATGANGTHAAGDSWKLKNAFLTDVKFGSLDYGSEDAVQITMTIRYDWAEMGANPVPQQ